MREGAITAAANGSEPDEEEEHEDAGGRSQSLGDLRARAEELGA